MPKFPQQKLKRNQEPFKAFCNFVSHFEKSKKNEIYYKGELMHKYIAWRKFLNYFRMMQDPDIELREADNKPIRSNGHAN